MRIRKENHLFIIYSHFSIQVEILVGKMAQQCHGIIGHSN
jgi:hypothetical protein